MCSAPIERVVGPDRLARAVELAGQRPVEDLRHERALAAARHAGDRHERARAGRAGRRPAGCARGRRGRRAPCRCPCRRLAGIGHRPLAAQERAGDRARLGEDHLERPVGDDLAAVLARPGPDVHDPVGGPDRLLVVLHDEHGVAEVAQPGQGRDELGVVALVEPDRGLVEDVQDAHQRRPDLGRQADPLGLAARQRHARPVEGQVVQPDVDEEPEPRDDLLEELVGDRPLALGQSRGSRPVAQRRASVIDIVETSQTLRSPIVTARISGRSRLPPQAGHGRVTMNFSSSALM